MSAVRKTVRANVDDEENQTEINKERNAVRNTANRVLVDLFLIDPSNSWH